MLYINSFTYKCISSCDDLTNITVDVWLLLLCFQAPTLSLKTLWTDTGRRRWASCGKSCLHFMCVAIPSPTPPTHPWVNLKNSVFIISLIWVVDGQPICCFCNILPRLRWFWTRSSWRKKLASWKGPSRPSAVWRPWGPARVLTAVLQRPGGRMNTAAQRSVCWWTGSALSVTFTASRWVSSSQTGWQNGGKFVSFYVDSSSWLLFLSGN